MAEAGTLTFLGNDQVYFYLGDNRIQFNPFQDAYDVNAQAFIDATGISGNDAFAINNLVVALKDNGLWNYFDAIYPMVGGTSTTCKFNLVNPADTNAAYRLNFQGGWTFNSSGAKPNGTTGYADTFYNLSTNLSTTNGCMSYYSFTNNAAGNKAEIGASATYENFIQVFYNSNRFYPNWGNGDQALISDSLGYFVVDVNPSGGAVLGYKNGTLTVTGTTSSGVANKTAYIGAINTNFGADRFSDRGCAFATIGDSIPTASMSTLATIVNNYQTALGRNVY